MTRCLFLMVFGFLSFWFSDASPSVAGDNSIILQSTTSAHNSGLFDHLLPKFRATTGIDVRVVAVGTGQAMRNAQNGDGDVLLVHSREEEEKFVAAGFGVSRANLMYNDFVIVGPKSDPAQIRTEKNVLAALRKIYQYETAFASRGDSSGTHTAELNLWKQAGLDPIPFSGDWYLETGSGMGTTLNLGVGRRAYVLTDRASWLSFRNKQDFEILFEGDERLFNQYGVILVNPKKHDHIDAENGQIFIDWLLSEAGQQAIASFQVAGEQLFFPNARQQ